MTARKCFRMTACKRIYISAFFSRQVLQWTRFDNVR